MSKIFISEMFLEEFVGHLIKFKSLIKSKSAKKVVTTTLPYFNFSASMKNKFLFGRTTFEKSSFLIFILTWSYFKQVSNIFHKLENTHVSSFDEKWTAKVLRWLLLLMWNDKEVVRKGVSHGFEDPIMSRKDKLSLVASRNGNCEFDEIEFCCNIRNCIHNYYETTFVHRNLSFFVEIFFIRNSTAQELSTRYSALENHHRFPFHQFLSTLLCFSYNIADAFLCPAHSSREFQGVVEAKAKAEVEVEGKMVNDGGDDVMYT
ncbi:CLUMA_CG002703, isoform A [Clunio marinus]|uniref:CLUMA_CG002703, isoform A n=1 Tax=Clunio marinus TaxID=568069 RepID=A0A1J1HNF5_9DIPT|nr:CLUMA_CG002703, isoform A [Clunio marinus]